METEAEDVVEKEQKTDYADWLVGGTNPRSKKKIINKNRSCVCDTVRAF